MSCGARLAPFDIEEVRDITMYDELSLDTVGDKKTALFLIMSDTDPTFNFLISMIYTQLFNLLCEKADDVYGGRLPVHVRCLIDECANIGQISRSGGLISGSTSVSDATLTAMQATLEGMDLGPLLGLYLQTFVVQVTMLALSAIIFVIVYGRMVEIYLMVSLAPIPFATFGNHEQSHTGQNYLRSLFALGFQGFLIMICVGIYAVLIQNLSFSDNIISSIWGVMGYTVLLAFTLFKTGSLAKSVFAAH